MSVRRCQQEVSSAEFTEWMAYSQIERFGPQMDDLRMGNVAAAIYNVNRDTETRPDAFGPADIFGWMEQPREEPRVIEDTDEYVLEIGALFGSRLKRVPQDRISE
ncbi:phage tail assembly protein T [Burkholderia ubonensis]|uniref:phage tail assembly protein T n=1 Tax=Burkholderia ubonensis TaxID=101571 RepID=UPI000A0F8DCD|nr:hypothetical protein [Burkholderia ubonensis]